MAVMEPDYNQYPTQSGGALVPSGGTGGALLAGGESDSGLPGSSGVASNFFTDLLGPAYKKYPLPAYVQLPVNPAPGPTSTPSNPTPPARGGGIPPVS